MPNEEEEEANKGHNPGNHVIDGLARFDHEHQRDRSIFPNPDDVGRETGRHNLRYARLMKGLYRLLPCLPIPLLKPW